MSARLSQLVTAAVLVDGFLAGASVDRTFVQLPAFRKTGVRQWAAFSRNADLETELSSDIPRWPSAVPR